MVELKGKRGNKVPLLLTPEVSSAMSVLMEMRSEVGVPLSNQYFFAKGTSGFIRFDDTLTKMCRNKQIHLVKPELITSTKLRKYTATLSQVIYFLD